MPAAVLKAPPTHGTNRDASEGQTAMPERNDPAAIFVLADGLRHDLVGKDCLHPARVVGGTHHPDR